MRMEGLDKGATGVEVEDDGLDGDFGIVYAIITHLEVGHTEPQLDDITGIGVIESVPDVVLFPRI